MLFPIPSLIGSRFKRSKMFSDKISVLFLSPVSHGMDWTHVNCFETFLKSFLYLKIVLKTKCVVLW